MIGALSRKISQLNADPVLRRWLTLRLLGREAGEPDFKAHRPPYLEGLLDDILAKGVPTPKDPQWSELPPAAPTEPLTLVLPGETLTLHPGEVGEVFARSYDDTETLLGLHRFAWLPQNPDVDPAWVNALWRAWADLFATPDDGWVWHPYTAAERAINILTYAERVGLPGPRAETLAILAAHAPDIAGKLEYFGDHHTSNHMANDGRGLYWLGVALGMEDYATLGESILMREAMRIFRPSGVLREESSHYHLLLTRQYTSCWLIARATDREETAAFEEVAQRALSVLPHMTLPGRFPLVGDVSPDCAPEHLAGLLPGGDPEQGWAGLLDEDERQALARLKVLSQAEPCDADQLRADGWLRLDFGPWSGLWHAAPDGWSHMPGHGHQDLGGFEVHYGDTPLFIDPGRGAYGEDGEAAAYRAALAHNNVTIDGQDPYAPNKPYYSDDFRHRVGGEPPRLNRGVHEVDLRHDGFERLSGVGRHERKWTLSERGLALTDTILGKGKHHIQRRLHTTLPVQHGGPDAVVLDGRFRVTADAPIRTQEIKVWTAYGRSMPGTRLFIDTQTRLPFNGTVTVEVL